MAVSAIAESGTIAVGDTATPNTLTFLSTQFLPAQVAFAAANGFNQTVFAAQALGLALAGTSGFQTDWAGLSSSAFVTSVASATGVNSSAIQGFLTNWTNFYTANGVPGGGLTVTQAAYGATLGDAIGVALLNPTSANLQSVFSTISGNSFSPNAGSGLVQNALIDVATGQYVVGDSLAALPIHTPLQGQSQPAIIFTLTTGVDTVPLTQNNSTVNGTYGGQGSGETWTAGDTITASPGTTNQTFNIDGIGTAFVLDVTSQGPGNAVSGVETVNIVSNVGPNGVSNQAIHGDFTATGPEGAWTGLTALNVTSAGNAAGVDVLTVATTTAVTIGDNLIANTNAALTVNGGLTDTITENNGNFHNDGITVNGGTGTTTVSITQTENFDGRDGIVAITDAAGTSSTLGTITSIVLNGITGGLGSVHNTIVDNALGNLSVWNSDSDGAILDITNNMTTTLNLNLNADGINADGTGHNWLVLNDIDNEYSTVHLTLGANNSYLLANANIVTLDTPNAGTGALVGGNQGPSEFVDHAATAVNLDFSGLNGANDIHVDRGSGVNNDVFTLGNFGTNNLVAANSQELIITNGNANNTDTINFGSGAYQIFDAPHAGTNNPHAYVNTAPNGAGLASGLPGLEQWADIHNSASGDTLQFKGGAVQNTINFGVVGSIQAGINDGLAQAPDDATVFHFAGNTFVFDHVGTSNVNISASDAMVELVGVNFTGSTAPGGIIHLA